MPKQLKLLINRTINEWNSKNRKMGCVAATNWFCRRVPSFTPLRIEGYTRSGDVFQHVVASNGKVIVDLVPELNSPDA